MCPWGLSITILLDILLFQLYATFVDRLIIIDLITSMMQ
jgi:hypothetical protein